MKSTKFHEIRQIHGHEIRRISWNPFMMPNEPRTNGPIFDFLYPIYEVELLFRILIDILNSLINIDISEANIKILWKEITIIIVTKGMMKKDKISCEKKIQKRNWMECQAGFFFAHDRANL